MIVITELCCNNPDLQVWHNEIVCRTCACVNPMPIFDYRESYSRSGSMPSICQHERIDFKIIGGTTRISRMDKDALGHVLSARQISVFQRLRILERKFLSSKQKSYKKSKQIKQRIMAAIEFTDPRNIADGICQWIVQTKYAHGRYFETTIAAAIIVASIEQNCTIDYDTIVQVAKTTKSAILRVVQDFLSDHPGGRNNFPTKLSREKFISGKRFVRPFCVNLGLIPIIEHRALSILNFIEHKLHTGHRPATKAAVAIYLALEESFPLKSIARVTQIQFPSLNGYLRIVRDLMKRNDIQKKNRE